LNLKEKRVDSKTLYRGKIVNLRVDTVTLPDGKKARREIVEHPGAVAVVPVLDDGSIVLVRQYRAPVGRVMLEIPAGTLKPGENPDSCAYRELEEETGFRAGKLERLITFYTSPGICNEIMYVYMASGLEKTAKAPDSDEFLEVTSVPLPRLMDMIARGEVVDGKTLVGVLSLFQFKGGGW